jgi:hypothetical protein
METTPAPAAPAPNASLRWSPAWIIEAAPAALLLSAGADRRVAIDGLDRDGRAAVARWQAGDAAVANDGAQRRLIDRLVALGVLVPALAPAWSMLLVGDPAVTRELAGYVGDGAETGTDRQPRSSDLVVAVRTGTDWPSVPDGHVHLGLDVALHHTVVIGPLVVPGASACLGCLDARIAARWPIPPVPPAPAVRQCLAVAAALLRVQAGLVAGATSPLVNATVAWDLERGTTDRQTLYKLTGCPWCDTGATTGRVALPWEDTP